jgi:hypothetical protein
MHDVVFLSSDPSIATPEQGFGVQVIGFHCVMWHEMRLFQISAFWPVFSSF